MLEEILIPIFALVTTFGTTFGIGYLFFMTRHRERLALIEKGADAKIFKTEHNPTTVLKYGLLFTGVGLGIIIGHLISPFFSESNQPAAYFSMIFIFGGMSLVIYYFIARKINRKMD